MNKQEVIDYILKEIETHQKDNSCQSGYRLAMIRAYDRVKQLDEPEKPIVPRFVAIWYEKNKGDFENNVYRYAREWKSTDNSDFARWFSFNDNEPIQTLVNMHQFGYEVEKEKLYTARLRLLNNDFNFLNRDKDNDRFLFSDDKKKHCYTTYFTQTELEELNVWENPAFEIKEVELKDE